MMKKFISVVLVCALIFSTAISLTSCGEDSEFPVTIGEITLDKEPERIVILNKNLSDIICAIGYDAKMVGRSDEVNQKEFKVVPSMGTAQDPSVKKIIKTKAEIVFADSSINTTAVSELKKAGINVFMPENANTIKQLSSLYNKTGRLLGGNVTGKSKAKKAFKEIKETLDAVKTAAVRDKIVSTAVYLYIDNGVLKTFTDGSWESTLLEYTGSMNVFGKADSDIVDPDNLALANPDNIFVADEDVVEYLQYSDTLSGLSALSENTFVIPKDELGLQGYSSLDIIEEMINDITGKNDEESSEEYESEEY